LLQRDDSIVPDPGWLAGVLDGKSGWFPESFVEIIPPDEAAALPYANKVKLRKTLNNLTMYVCYAVQ